MSTAKQKDSPESLNKRRVYEKLVADWHRNRATLTGGTADDDDAMDSALERDRELAILIATTPTPLPFCIDHKLSIFEHYLCAEMDSPFTDHRLLILFAGIRADLIRFNIVVDGA